MAQVDREIETELSDLRSFYDQRRLLGLKELVEERSQWRPAQGAVYLLAYRRSGEYLGGNVPHWPADASFETPFTFLFTSNLQNSADVKIRARAIVLNNAFTLLIGRSLEPRMALVNDFRNILPFIAASLGLMGFAASYIIGRLLLGRLEAINATSRLVEAGQLAARAPGAEHHDEIGDVARHINRMLDRINWLVEESRASSDRIAHELRTPMTRMRAQLEQAAALSDGGAREKIEQAIDETRRLSVIFDALLDISRIETNASNTSELTGIDLVSIVGDVIEFYAPVAEERGIGLQVILPKAVDVRGERVLLQRMIVNLVDNAVKFSPDNSRMVIELVSTGPLFKLTVRDSGSGMEPEFAARAFERFSRAPSSSRHDGFGLGLAIVAAIVQRHGFEISAQPGNPGLSMVVSGGVSPGEPPLRSIA